MIAKRFPLYKIFQEWALLFQNELFVLFSTSRTFFRIHSLNTTSYFKCPALLHGNLQNKQSMLISQSTSFPERLCNISFRCFHSFTSSPSTSPLAALPVYCPL
ncbi:hypothetical protein CW304_32780 [Bacillus sp. UFRGS-B20]|nr:hypothetical protein CW304_32780 [Bacillus sp. UFRGS-B20]